MQTESGNGSEATSPEAQVALTFPPYEQTTKPTLSIIVPAFNEAKSLRTVLESLLSLRSDQDSEIIVVDDGSHDQTAEVASAFPVTLFRHPYNKGYGAALKTGIRQARGDLIIFFDADGQHRADDIEVLLAEAGIYDVVIGARTKQSKQNWLRKPGKIVLGFVANLMAGRKISDLNSGLRLFHKHTVEHFIDLMPQGFSFSTTSTIAAYYFGFNVGYVPITTSKRQAGKSSVRQVRHGFGTLILILRLITLFEPLKVFLPLATFLLGAGLISAIVDICFYDQGLADATLLFLHSFLVIFFLGLLADQISALRKERAIRPR
jgi:glycosyltransferase involved in cell wall biosynthesis